MGSGPDRTAAVVGRHDDLGRVWIDELAFDDLPRTRHMTATEVRLRQAEMEAEAQERATALLKENLTPEQREQYEKHKWFEVRGSDTGNRYRIKQGRQMNIEQVDKKGRRVAGFCFLPQGGLAAGDVMLAQKISLETREQEALAVANRF